MDAWDWTPYLATPDDTPEAAHARWYAAGIADGLPIIPPTSARIRAMYRSSAAEPVRPVAALEPSLRLATVYDLAVCAVAAGCPPGSLAVLAAAVHAVSDPAFNLLGIQSTTGTAAPVLVVHGPEAARLEVSGGPDCLGGSVQANATLGRALRLLLRSVGGGVPGGMDAATMGQPAKLGLCFAEAVAASPWPPLHTTLGFAADTSAVTAVGVSGTIEIVHAESDQPLELLITLAQCLRAGGGIGSRGLIGGESPLLVLSHEHARLLFDAGHSRERTQGELWSRVRLPLDQIAPSVAARIRLARATAGEVPDEPLRLADKPADILIAVAGGVGVKSTYLPSWGGGTRAVTVAV